MSDVDEEPPPVLQPYNRNRIVNHSMMRLPVQLTWKGVEIYFPSVVLTRELKEKADEALKQRIIRESTTTGFSPRESESEEISTKVPEIFDDGEQDNTTLFKPALPVPHSSNSKEVLPRQKKKCSVCEREFATGFLLKRHMKVHSIGKGKSKRKHGPCEKCGARFLSSSSFKKHVASCAVGEKSFHIHSTVIKLEKNDEEYEDTEAEAAEETPESHFDNGSLEASQDAEVNENVDEKLNSTVNKGWGDMFLEKYKERQHPLHLDSEALKAKLEEKRLANLKNDSTCSSDSSECIVKTETEETHDIVDSDPQPGTDKEVFKCSACSAVFISTSFLDLHVQKCRIIGSNTELGHSPPNENSSQQFQCEVCNKEFSSYKNLYSHRKIHKHIHRSVPVSCDICNRKFSAPKYLKQHVRIHEGDSMLVIGNVIGSFQSGSQNLGVGSAANIESRLNCNRCGKIFANKYNLHRHTVSKACLESSSNLSRGTSAVTLQVRDSKKPCKCFCPVCGKMFMWRTSLNRHMRNYHNQGFKCSGCDMSFTSLTRLNEHCKTELHIKNYQTKNTSDFPKDSQNYNKKESLSFNCDACGKQFEDKMTLSRHCLSHALDEFSITEGDQLLSSKTVLPNPDILKISSSSSETVISRTSGTIPKPDTDSSEANVGLIYSCNYKSCTHGFSHDEDLWYHIEKKHKSLGNLCCSRCGQDCDSEASLSLHNKSVHLIEESGNEEDVDESDRDNPIKVETQEVHFEDDYQESQDDYHEPQDDYDQDNYEVEENSVPESMELERLKAKILRNNKTEQPFVLISSECQLAAEEALNSLDSDDFAENDNHESEGDSFQLHIPIQDYYTCENCPSPKIFYNRTRYISHLNYHTFVKRRGIEWSGIRKRKGKGFGIDSLTPIQDVYRCESCPGNREFTQRKAYINHLNYHETMRKKGREWVIGTERKGLRRREDIPDMDVYTCEICNGKIFPDRITYINHVNYHEKMRAEGREWTTGKDKARGRRREDIPDMDVYTCHSETCNGKSFPDRISYINHVNYHDKMKAAGREWLIGSRLRGKHPVNILKTIDENDIPDMDVYTCPSGCCSGKTFNTKMAYIAHLKYHEAMKARGREWAIGMKRGPKYLFSNVPVQDSYTCDKCEDSPTFTERDEYISHLKSHDESRPRIISTGTRKRRRRTRLRYDIPYQDDYTCEICENRVFTNRSSFINHMAYHKTLSRQGKQGMRRRTRRTDIPHQDVYTCKFCSQVYPLRSKYITHLYYHEVLEPKVAKQRALKKGEVKDQASDLSTVPVKSVYLCKSCPEIRVFHDRSKYLQHLSYHKSKQKQIDNELSKEDAEVAEREDIPNQDTYVCKLCAEDKIFTLRSSYLKHLRYHKVMQDKTYQCSVCEKAFSSVWNLSAHARTHTNEKTFICGDCGKRFRMKHGLKNHQPKCKKVPCKYTCHCGDKFHSIQFLGVHVSRFHKDGSSQPVPKKFRCYVCNQEFIQAYELKMHVKEFHPSDYLEFVQQKVSEAAATTFASGNSAGDFRNEEKDDNEPSPFIPEIVMKTENVEMQSLKPEPPETFPADPTLEESTLITLPPAEIPSWNFIPELEDMDTDPNEEGHDYYQEFLPESFEPEEIEVQACALNSNASLEAHGSKPTSSTETESNFKSSETLNESSNSRVSKKSLNHNKPPGRFKCAFCSKTSHKEKFIKSHHKVKHQNLGPYKCLELVDSSNNKDTPSYTNSNLGQTLVNWSAEQSSAVSKLLDLPSLVASNSSRPDDKQVPSTSSTSTSGIRPNPPFQNTYHHRYKCGYCDTTFSREVILRLHLQSEHKGLVFNCIELSKFNKPVVSSPMQYTLLSQLLEAPNKPAVSKSSSTDSTQQKQPAVIETCKPGPKSKLRCNCCISDTALGFLKRCVGSQCPCYLNTKKCSDECICKSSCSNPYFRFRTPPVKRNLPDLVPVSIVPTMSMMANASPKPLPQYTLQIMEHQSTSINPCTTKLDQMLANTALADDGVQASSSTMPRRLSLQSNSVRVVPDLQPMQEMNSKISDNFVNCSEMLKCRYCVEEFGNLSSYLTHQWSHKYKSKYCCPLCKKEFKVISHLVLHARTHYNHFPCPTCSASFKSKNDLNSHFKSTHSPQECTVCRILFPTALALAAHMQKDHCLCEICGENFGSAYLLKRHLEVSHSVPVDSQYSQGNADPEIQTIDMDMEDVEILEESEEVEILEERPASPPMPVIVDSSSVAVEPVYHFVDINQLIQNSQGV